MYVRVCVCIRVINDRGDINITSTNKTKITVDKRFPKNVDINS